ncbi:MAG: hypothetical protein IAF38_13785 [Bacteroidia bacterium]|nr:hypothetical protein [Bacteroidia bacterium]
MSGKRNFAGLILVLFLSVSFFSFSQKDDKTYLVEIANGLSGNKFVIGKMNIKGENLNDAQIQTLNYSFAKGNKLKIEDASLIKRLKKSSKTIKAKKITLKIESVENPKEISVLIVIE